MWTVVLQGTGVRPSDLLLTTLLLDWPSYGDMKPQPRRAVDPRSEIVASECIYVVLSGSKMDACGGAEAVVQGSPLVIWNEMVCARNGEGRSVGVGFLEYVSELVLLNFCCISPQGMGKHAPPPTSSYLLLSFSVIVCEKIPTTYLSLYPVWTVE